MGRARLLRKRQGDPDPYEFIKPPPREECRKLGRRSAKRAALREQKKHGNKQTPSAPSNGASGHPDSDIASDIGSEAEDEAVLNERRGTFFDEEDLVPPEYLKESNKTQNTSGPFADDDEYMGKWPSDEESSDDMSVSEDGASGDGVSGDDVSGDDVSGDDVSGDDVSGDDVSGDDVSGDNIANGDADAIESGSEQLFDESDFSSLESQSEGEEEEDQGPYDVEGEVTDVDDFGGDSDDGSEINGSAVDAASDASDLEDGDATDLRSIEQRLRKNVQILGNWREKGAAVGVSRATLQQRVIDDICKYFGYSEYLADKLFNIFSPEEALAFFMASDTPRPVTLRVNTLKTRRRDLAQTLINRGVNLQPIEGGWTKVGLQVYGGSSVPVGATPEYLAGHYMLQAASSFLPVIALDPQPNDRVLDMSAAPGGKTTHLAALLGNTGQVWANDNSRARLKGLSGNVARLGCENVIITNVDGRAFPKLLGGFDRVILDAPCSGTGVISKDQSVKTHKNERDFMLLPHLQKQLVLCAIDSVKPGGYVVYSTCSVAPEEDEAVVAYALRKRPHIKLVETGLEIGIPGFKSHRGKHYGDSLVNTRRFYPHIHNMDGFFVSKFFVGKPQKPKQDDD